MDKSINPGLFGLDMDAEPGSKLPTRDTARFTDEEVDQYLDLVADELIDQFNESIKQYMVDKRSGKSMDDNGDLFGHAHIRVESKRRLYENLCWAFDLYQSEVPCSFKWACADKSEPEHIEPILTYLAHALADELRELVVRLSAIDMAEGKRVAEKLKEYLPTTVYFQ